MTDTCLRPDPKTLGDEWRTIVLEEYEQVERLREWRNEDYYQPVAQHFSDDPHRTDDEILNRLKEYSSPDASWLDIGAGGGRYALPLALVSGHVTAVEKSQAMREVLEADLATHGIDNVDVVEATWPEPANELSADYCLMAHVGYDLRDINGFLDGIERSARKRCFSLMMDRAPSGGFIRLWEQVHGEPRKVLPAMREFVMILLARGATPEIETFYFPRRPRDEDAILASARQRLWLAEGSEKDQSLQELLTRELADGVDDYDQPRLVALIAW